MWLVVMSIKLTGINHNRMKMVMPRGQVLGKGRREVVVYLGMPHTIGMVIDCVQSHGCYYQEDVF